MVSFRSIAIISLTAVIKHHTALAFVTTSSSSSLVLECSKPRTISSLRASTTEDLNLFSEEQVKDQQKEQMTEKQPRTRKRARFLQMLGIKKHPKEQKKIINHEDEDNENVYKPDSWNGHSVKVTTEQGLDEYFDDVRHRFRKNNASSDSAIDNGDIDEDNEDNIDYLTLLSTLCVEGDTQIIGSPNHPQRVHPVLRLLHERRRSSSGVQAKDGYKVALSIEGGGMRGCVSAGMVAAIHYLGLEDAFDVVYGSSAGSVIGSYFITKQLPWYGPEIYYDSLSKAGVEFIDTRRLTRAVGLGLLDPRLLKDVIVRPKIGKPVLNLAYLLKKTAQEEKPLDWETFKKRQSVQPLKIVASALNKEKSIILDMENGSFETMSELGNCMHASCLLPGIAGPVVRTKMPSQQHKTEGSSGVPVTDEASDDDTNLEPLADALIYEPLPYPSALKEGATHVVVLRTRPDGVDVTGKMSVFQRLIMKRFFLRKNNLPNIYRRMRRGLHKKVYAKSVLFLNEAAHDEREYSDVSKPHLMTIAVGPDSPEVTTLETRREEIFEGVRRGFARAYDALVEDPAERGRGVVVANQYFPDQILDYDPSKIDSSSGTSAFDIFLKDLEEKGAGYDNLPDTLGKTAAQAGAPR